VLGPLPDGKRQCNRDWYPVAAQPSVTDRLDFEGPKGELTLVSAGTVDPRYPTREKILTRLGQPEAQVLFQTQELLDYSEKGLRFVCNRTGNTIGVIYFQAGERRVPAGYPDTCNLRRSLPEAKQASPPKDFMVGTAEISVAPQRFDDVAIESKQQRYYLHEDVWARVAIFQHGANKIVLVGMDVFGLTPWDLGVLRRSLAQLGFEQVLIAMSHTHANVDTLGYFGYYPKAYVQHILAQTKRVVQDAAKNMKPIRSLKMGSVEMPLAGGRVADVIYNVRRPGLIDPTVSLIQAVGQDGKPIVNVIHLACRPEAIRLRDKRGISPDYVGTLCNEVRRQLGGQPVFINGAMGGMLMPDIKVRGYESAAATGKAMARFVVQAAALATPTSSYGLWLHRRPVQYPITNAKLLEYLSSGPSPGYLVHGRIRTEMNAVWIGDAQLITVPGALLPELGFEIMSHMKGRLRLIVGLANDEIGYFVPSYDFHAGQYEERTGPGAAGGEITQAVGLELAPLRPPP